MSIFKKYVITEQLYYSHRLGLQSEAIMFSKEGKDEGISRKVFSNLNDNFEWLWANSLAKGEASLICLIDKKQKIYNEILIQNLEQKKQLC
jgi:hypothetical protein